MSVASIRTGFRGLTPIQSEHADPADQARTFSAAIRQLQDIIRIYPVGVVSISATYSMVDIDLLILADATSLAFPVNLLTAKGREGRRFIVKKTDASNNVVTITPSGTEKLDNASTVGLTEKNAAREYVSDGTNWQLIGALGNANTL